MLINNNVPQARSLPNAGDTLADQLVEYLDKIGVESVFGVPGGAIEPFYNALARSERRGGVRAVLARHESGAAFMADGHARISGGLGVCCATSGPGATNLATGVATAYVNQIPMLVITAQSRLESFGSGAVQESSSDAVDTVAMFNGCTRYSTLVSHPEQLRTKLIAALSAAFGSPRGPVHLSIPSDILNAPMEVGALPNPERLMRGEQLFDLEGCNLLAEELKAEGRTVLVVGGGALGAWDEVSALAERLDAPIVSTPQGKGAVDAYHPLYRGVLGFAGHREAAGALRDPDVTRVLLLGSGYTEPERSPVFAEALKQGKVFHVDPVKSHFARTPEAWMHVIGGIGPVCRSLVGALGGRRDSGERYARLSAPRIATLVSAGEPTPIKPQLVMQALARSAPEQAVFLPDSGTSFFWALHHLHPRGAGRFHIDIEFGTMGWAIGAAVGVAAAEPGRPVVCITGDGSFLMNGQEITVALRNRLPVLYVIMNNGVLGMVRHGQRLRGAEQVATELPAVDFAAMARAMGVRAERVETVHQLQSLDLAALLEEGGPLLLDVWVDPDETPPMGSRIEALEGELAG